MKVLNIGRWDSGFENGLKQEWPDITFYTAETHEAVMKHMVGADVVWGHISEEMYQASRCLRWVQHKGAGMNWLTEVPGLVKSDVTVTNAAGAAADSVADQTMASLLALSRQVPDLVHAQMQHRWITSPEHSPITLFGRALGILGFGHIGRAVAKRAAAFGMRVVALDVATDTYRLAEKVFPPENLSEFLETIDDLAVCVPLTEATRKLICAEELQLLGEDGYVIVVSRSGIVDESSLVTTLREGRLAGAALDVQEHELVSGQHSPLPSTSELWDVPRLIITPHSAAHAPRTKERTQEIFRENLRRFIGGRELANVVDKRMGF